MNIEHRIASLNDYDAMQVLNRAIEGFVAADSDVARYDYLSEVWSKVTSQTGVEVTPLRDEQIQQLGKGNPAQAAKAVLLEWTADPKLSGRVEAALTADRKVLIEPVSTALVLAGIIIALQTRASLTVERKDGKLDVKLDLEKKPTSDSIISKFFSFFGK